MRSPSDDAEIRTLPAILLAIRGIRHTYKSFPTSAKGTCRQTSSRQTLLYWRLALHGASDLCGLGRYAES